MNWIKNRTYYFFSDIINIKNLDLDNIKKIEKSYKNNLIHYVGYMTSNNVQSLFLVINSITEYLMKIMEVSI